MTPLNHHGEPVKMVSIPADEYEEMQRDLAFLNCLQNAGVDNWDGYEFAQEDFREQYPDDED